MPTLRAFRINSLIRSMKRFFFKFPNSTLSSSTHSHSLHRPRLRISDILLIDEHDGAAAVHSMENIRDTPTHDSPRPIKFYSPKRLVAWFLAALKLTKKRRILQRRQKITPSSPMINDLRGNEEVTTTRQIDWNDTSFKLGVGCGLLYLIAATKNELGKMVELRKEMETLLQNMKGELQSKDAIPELLKQSDTVACSITDIQEVSCSNSHPSVHSQRPNFQQESKSNMVGKRTVDYDISEQDECGEEITELQAEFEYELQRLQLYLDGEAGFEDTQQDSVEVNINDSSSKSQSSSFGEIIMEPHGASSDVSFGVSPVELERRLHELLETRLQERITELESALEYTTQKLNKKAVEVSWWEDSESRTPHVPETSRFTFRLDPETGLKLSQIVG